MTLHATTNYFFEMLDRCMTRSRADSKLELTDSKHTVMIVAGSLPVSGVGTPRDSSQGEKAVDINNGLYKYESDI